MSDQHPPRYVATARLWTDEELAAAHALATSVMTPAAEPTPQCRLSEAPIDLIPVTPKRTAYDDRLRARRRASWRRKNPPRPKATPGRIGSPDTARIWSKGGAR